MLTINMQDDIACQRPRWNLAGGQRILLCSQYAWELRASEGKWTTSWDCILGLCKGWAVKCFPAAQRNEKDEIHFYLILLPSDSVLLAKYLK